MTQKTFTERRKEMNEGLAQDIKDIKSILQEIKTAEAARAEREKSMREDVDRLKEAVHGNGKPGLKTEVEILRENDKKRGANQNTIVVAIIIQIFMMILTKVL